jgi:hypothetical protein
MEGQIPTLLRRRTYSQSISHKNQKYLRIDAKEPILTNLPNENQRS